MYCALRQHEPVTVSDLTVRSRCAAASGRRHLARPDRSATGQPAETLVLLESAAIALGAPTMTAEQIGLARAVDHAFRACRHDMTEAARLAQRFHAVLLDGCPNAHMVDLVRRESARMPPAAPMSGASDSSWHGELDRIADDHDAILDMIAAGASPRDLERSLRRHGCRSALCSSAAR